VKQALGDSFEDSLEAVNGTCGMAMLRRALQTRDVDAQYFRFEKCSKLKGLYNGSCGFGMLMYRLYVKSVMEPLLTHTPQSVVVEDFHETETELILE